jgi:hypothetical protein
MFNPETAPGGGSYFLPSFEAAARSLKVEPIVAPVHSDAEIETVIASLHWLKVKNPDSPAMTWARESSARDGIAPPTSESKLERNSLQNPLSIRIGIPSRHGIVLGRRCEDVYTSERFEEGTTIFSC